MASIREQLIARAGTLLNGVGTPAPARRGPITSVARGSTEVGTNAPVFHYFGVSDSKHALHKQERAAGQELTDPPLTQRSGYPLVGLLELHVECIVFGTGTTSAEQLVDPLMIWAEKQLVTGTWSDIGGISAALMGTTFADAGEDASAIKAKMVFRIAYTQKAGDPEVAR